jgi:hypothetical protein
MVLTAGFAFAYVALQPGSKRHAGGEAQLSYPSSVPVCSRPPVPLGLRTNQASKKQPEKMYGRWGRQPMLLVLVRPDPAAVPHAHATTSRLAPWCPRRPPRLWWDGRLLPRQRALLPRWPARTRPPALPRSHLRGPSVVVISPALTRPFGVPCALCSLATTIYIVYRACSVQTEPQCAIGTLETSSDTI